MELLWNSIKEFEHGHWALSSESTMRRLQICKLSGMNVVDAPNSDEMHIIMFTFARRGIQISQFQFALKTRCFSCLRMDPLTRQICMQRMSIHIWFEYDGRWYARAYGTYGTWRDWDVPDVMTHESVARAHLATKRKIVKRHVRRTHCALDGNGSLRFSFIVQMKMEYYLRCINVTIIRPDFDLKPNPIGRHRKCDH